jgi:hypothetical protein
MNIEYPKDCIHLHACRRLTQMCKTKGFSLVRACNEDCSAYLSGDTGSYVTADTALEFARDGAESIRRGYDTYDVYASCDLYPMTLNEIIQSEEK